MRRNRLPLIGLLIAVLAGCSYESRSTPAAPSSSTLQTFVGSWASPTGLAVPSASSCSGLDWRITSIQGNVVSGEFSATCAGGLQVSGTGTGTPNGDALDLTANGTATQAGVQCQFALTGRAVHTGPDTIRVDYSGTVCGLPVQGAELLNRR